MKVSANFIMFNRTSLYIVTHVELPRQFYSIWSLPSKCINCYSYQCQTKIRHLVFSTCISVLEFELKVQAFCILRIWTALKHNLSWTSNTRVSLTSSKLVDEAAFKMPLRNQQPRMFQEREFTLETNLYMDSAEWWAIHHLSSWKFNPNLSIFETIRREGNLLSAMTPSILRV